MTAIVTTDADFTRIPGATIYTCNEKILSRLHIRGFAFVGESGVAGDDKQAGYAGEVTGEHFGDAVAEIVLLWVATHVVKRQYDDGRFVGQGQRRWRDFSPEC